MDKHDKTSGAKAPPPGAGPDYGTFPHVTTHGPRDRRSFHGKPEDWQRARAQRTFGGKVK